MTSDAVLLDGYVDEPTCLGVPPYLSPYIRYMAGVLSEHGYRTRYLTIDQLRQDPSLYSSLDQAEVVVLIAGLTVPGKYLGGTPATLTEIQQLGMSLRHPQRILGGPIHLGYAGEGGKRAVRQPIAGFDAVLTGPPAESLDAYLSEGALAAVPEYERIDRWAVQGAGILPQHPNFPYVMCELETGRGCPRTLEGGCSFCTERFQGPPRYRSREGIEGEIAALYEAGARHFRLGTQPDLLVYGSGGGAYPVPRPERLEALFQGIHRVAPDLETLHIDNVNPGTIARHEEKAREALSVIVRWHTPGDVAALGMETADPVVVKANNLKADPEEVFRAIALINEVGAYRTDGIPELLPGLNFVLGLAGETLATYERNRRFLEEILTSGLLVRRVNLRQVMPFEGTPVYDDNTLDRYPRQFRAFKDWVRHFFDLPMLRKVFPVGTIYRQVIVEESGSTSFGRPLGSYPILVGIPLPLPERMVLDVVVVDHGMRSITALPYPVEVNRLPPSALAWIPMVGKKRVTQILQKRPFKDDKEFRDLVGLTGIEDALQF
jgi:radical SAM superfamily enzyme with C-terminal helix-hairpin-helix motif